MDKLSVELWRDHEAGAIDALDDLSEADREDVIEQDLKLAGQPEGEVGHG